MDIDGSCRATGKARGRGALKGKAVLTSADPGPQRTGHVERDGAGGGQEAVLGHHLVHQPRFLGGAVPQGLAGQHELHRLGHAHGARQALRAAQAGDETQLQLRQAHRRACMMIHYIIS